MENQNPTPPVSETPKTTLPVILSDAKDPASPVSNPIKPASKFSIKTIIGIIIFLLLAGGAAAGFVYREPILKLVSNPTPTPTVVISPTPTPDPTADWRTYEGEGFTLKYPYSFKFNDSGGTAHQDGTTSKIISFWNSTEIFGELLGSGKYFTVKIRTSGNLDLDAWLKSNWLDYNYPIPQKDLANSIKNSRKFTISNLPAVRIAHPAEKVYFNFIEGKGKIAELACVQYGGDISQICDNAFQSFKFTDLQTTENNDWKLYEDETLSFQYPQGWVATKTTDQILLKANQGDSGYVELKISTKTNQLTDYSSIPTCDESEPNKECIATEGWEQKNAIENITLGNKKAVSFYLSGFGDYARHVVQTLENPKIELNMNVAGGGLDGTFSKILTSLKFLKQ